MLMSKTKQPKTRNYVAQAAWSRNSAGPMGGNKRTRNRRDRKAARRALKQSA